MIGFRLGLVIEDSCNITTLVLSAAESQFNPYLTNGFSHHYHLDESTSVLGGVRFFFFF